MADFEHPSQAKCLLNSPGCLQHQVGRWPCLCLLSGPDGFSFAHFPILHILAIGMTPIPRRSVRDTNVHHRHDALSPLDLLTIERLRSSIRDKLSVCLDTVTFSSLLAAHTMSEVENGNVAYAAQVIATATSGLYDMIAADIYVEVMQLLALEYTMSEGRIITYCRRARRRFIDDLETGFAYHHTRHTKKQLKTILRHWRIPEFIEYSTDPKHIYREPGETCLIVTLTFMSTESPLYHLFETTFGGDSRPWGRLMAEFVKIIVTNFYHKISGRSLELYTNRLGVYAMAIANRVASQVLYKEKVYADGRIEGTYAHVEMDPTQAQVVGFIDDTSIYTCKPGVSLRERGETDQDFQKAIYSGFMKRHGLKAQTIYHPDGMVASVFVDSLRQNDNGMFNLSNLSEYLLDTYPEMPNPINDAALRYALYGDMIFQRHECLINRPHGVQDEADEVIFDRFDSMRVSIEMLYGRLKTLYPLFGGSRRLRLMRRTGETSRFVLFAFFSLNCLTCMNGCSATSMYKLEPPTIDEYLPLHEELEPAPLVVFANEDVDEEDIESDNEGMDVDD